jgi:hypothetical protein
LLGLKVEVGEVVPAAAERGQAQAVKRAQAKQALVGKSELAHSQVLRLVPALDSRTVYRVLNAEAVLAESTNSRSLAIRVFDDN